MQGIKVKDLMGMVAPQIWHDPAPDCRHWPGDVFACAAAILERSGAYSVLGTHTWPPDHREWQNEITRVATEWKARIARAIHRKSVHEAKLPAAPRMVQGHWARLVEQIETPLKVVAGSKSLIRSLLTLLAVTDTVFAGVGLRRYEGFDLDSSIDVRDLDFDFESGLLLEDIGRKLGQPKDSTLCLSIDPSRLRVLPKSQTPRNGLSLRSLTCNLSFCPPTNIPVSWHGSLVAPNSVGDRVCNFLLVPWPFQVRPEDFSMVGALNDRQTGWFGYRPYHTHVGQIVDVVERMLRQAESIVGANGVHAVVLPELSLTREQFGLLANILSNREIGLIAGVGSSPPTENQRRFPQESCENFAAISFPSPIDTDGSLTVEQHKHHRWRLDSNQIVRYGLTNQLDPTYDWWEGIKVDARSLNFVVLREWLSTCVLVCEDLARLDPIGRYVRAVGPDLVIALLMDGPQLRDRWPAYHATVLTDDPGSSVLTLTSLGMVTASRPVEMLGKSHRRTIGMWRDASRGLVEIDLPEGCDGALLTLHRQSIVSLTADGRTKQDAGAPMYGGLHFLKAAPLPE